MTTLTLDRLIRDAALAVAADGRSALYVMPVPPGCRTVAGFPAGQPIGRGVHWRYVAAHVVAWCAAQDPDARQADIFERGAPRDLTGWVEEAS